jgi:tRNA C32,U32 (ribose-2'-O)-methylase TrmJ
VYGADTSGEPMWETDLTGGIALVFGAEGKGLRPLVRRTCDAALSIPLAGRVESLNVSVAAAVLLYEARRQRAAVEKGAPGSHGSTEAAPESLWRAKASDAPQSSTIGTDT